MYKSILAIYNTLKDGPGLKVFTDDLEKQSVAWLQFRIKNGGNYRIQFIATSDKGDIAVRIFSLVRFDPEKIPQLLPVLNSLNCKFRYVKFTCDNDGDVNLEYDYPSSCSHPEETVLELVLRLVKIVDDSYPDIMRAMWS